MAERSVHLDPSELLGFRIVADREDTSDDARLGGKVGEVKEDASGSRMGAKVGVGGGKNAEARSRLGAKVGGKIGVGGGKTS